MCDPPISPRRPHYDSYKFRLGAHDRPGTGNEYRPEGNARSTDKQVKAIYAIGRNARKMQPAEVDAYCGEQYQGRKPSELTKREASTLIDDLKAEQAA